MSEERWDIPASWCWAGTKELSSIVGGGTPSTKDPKNFSSNGIHWLTPADLSEYEATYISRGKRDLSDAGFAKSGATIMPAGTVLFTSRAPIGYCAIAANPIATNQGFKSLVPEVGVVPEYLRYYLLSSKDYAESLASGTTFLELSGKKMAELAVPVAPTAEQKRIVAKLDSLSACLSRAREEMAYIPRLVSRYKQAVLAAVFSDDAPRDWERLTVNDVVQSTFYGPRFDKNSYREEGVPTLRTTDIEQFGRIVLKEPPRVKVDEADLRKWQLEDGDIIVTRTGATIGKCALYKSSMGPMLPSAYLIRVRPDIARINPEFLLFSMLSPRGQRHLMDGRTAVAQPNINANAIRSLPINVPSIDLQLDSVRHIRKGLEFLDRVAVEYKRASMLFDRLDQSILAKAFSGELVPQDPNDEPASVLLERIRAERATTPKPKRPRKNQTDQTARAPKGKAAMTKARQDEDVLHKPYLATLLKETGGTAKAEDLFKKSRLPVADFYKQLAWEVERGHIRDDLKKLEAV